MKIIECQQNSLEWMTLRSGIPTASEFDNLISPTWQIRDGRMVESYLARKLAEAWIKGPLPGWNTIDMEFGKILEDEAIPWLTFETGDEIQRVGLVTTDDGRVGCSPDGLIGDDGGVEVKCPEAHTHVGYLLAGEVPPQYLAQVHGAMWVTGRAWWKFVSYRRRFPPLVKVLERDDKIQAVLTEAIAAFLDKFDAAMKRLREMNGGPPLRPKTPTPKAEYTLDENDVPV